MGSSGKRKKKGSDKQHYKLKDCSPCGAGGIPPISRARYAGLMKSVVHASIHECLCVDVSVCATPAGA